MSIMAIDYGEKRVGIATTDESNEFALPRVVLENTPKLLNEICELREKWNIEKIILGDSKKFDGSDNLIAVNIKRLKKELEEKGIVVIMHPEFLTSLEAKQLQGKNEMLDASAAAIILKSYIDMKNN